MATVSVPTRIEVELDREYIDLSIKTGMKVSHIRRQVLQNPELKITYSIPKLLDENKKFKDEVEKLKEEVKRQKEIIDQGIEKVLEKQGVFFEKIREFMEVEDEFYDIIFEEQENDED